MRLALFSLALDAGDDDGMKEAQDKILQIVGDQERQQLVVCRSAPQAVADAAGTPRPRIAQRNSQAWRHRPCSNGPTGSSCTPCWARSSCWPTTAPPHSTHYDRAEQLGRPAPTRSREHIRLLVANGRYADAGKLLDRIPEGGRQQLLGPLYSEILFRTNQVDAALKQARAATETDPKNAQNQYWYGQLLARSSQASDVTPQQRNEIMGEAIKAMQRATELQPEFPDAWFALINYHAMQKDEAQAQKTMRDAQLALSGDNLPIFLARSYEVLHRWFDAETMYREIYETSPGDLGRAQQLAAFYLGPIYQRPDRRDKGDPADQPNPQGGRREKGPGQRRQFALGQTHGRQDLFDTRTSTRTCSKPRKLLASNSQDGNLLIEDKLAMAEILAPRPEPLSRLKAIGLLEEVSKVQPLNELAEIQLGELYYAVGGT